MTPSSFDESNDVLDTPRDRTPEDVTPLAVCRVVCDGGPPVVISCWRPDAAELAEIVRTGRVWLIIEGVTHPPLAVTGWKPFKTVEGG